MIRLVKGMFRTGVIATVLVGAAVGGAARLAGKARTRAVIDKVHTEVMRSIASAMNGALISLLPGLGHKVFTRMRCAPSS